MKISTLQALLSDLKTKNNAVTQSRIVLETARGARNTVLYTPLTGVVDIGTDVKSYIKSVFGVNSTQYKLVSKLRFVKL